MLPSEKRIFLIATKLIDQNNIITLEDLYLYTQMRFDIIQEFLDFCYTKNFITKITYDNLDNLQENYSRFFQTKSIPYGEIKTFENHFYKFNNIGINYFDKMVQDVNKNVKKLEVKDNSHIKIGSLIALIVSIFVFVFSFTSIIDVGSSNFNCYEIPNYNGDYFRCLYSQENKDWEAKKSESITNLSNYLVISSVVGFTSFSIFVSTED
jgi:hypothetical protein